MIFFMRVSIDCWIINKLPMIDVRQQFADKIYYRLILPINGKKKLKTFCL